MRLSLEQSKSLAKWMRKYHPRSVGAEEVGEPDLGELDFVVRGDDCVEWGASATKGYGQFSMATPCGRRPFRPHRALREIVEGESDLNALHRCGNKLCVNLDHTYYGTQSDNWQDCVRMGESKQIGETATQSKLTADQVGEIRRRYIPTRGRRLGNGRELELEFGLSRSYVSQIMRGDRWQH